jgi:hypothetical protein
MAKYTQIEKKRLWELARQGKSIEEMMKILDIREMQRLKQEFEELFREKGESIPVPGLIGEPSVRAKYSDEGIRIDPSMLEGTGFRAGDEFDLKVTNNRITLDRREKESS